MLSVVQTYFYLRRFFILEVSPERKERKNKNINKNASLVNKRLRAREISVTSLFTP